MWIFSGVFFSYERFPKIFLPAIRALPLTALNDALRAAQSDYRKRGDEIYADDTMAWVLAAKGRWQAARTYAERAVRYGTQDSEVQYHAGLIAMETGHPLEATHRFTSALRVNPHCDPIDAGDARARLKKLNGPSATSKQR